MWRTSYTPSGLLWGHSGFWYVISEIPVYLCVACCPCTLFQFEQAGQAHGGASRKWYYFYRRAGPRGWASTHSPSDSSNISRTELYDGEKLTRQRGRKWTEISFGGINPSVKQAVSFLFLISPFHRLFQTCLWARMTLKERKGKLIIFEIFFFEI